MSAPDLENMTPEEFAQWKEDYYTGIMCCPFGEKSDGTGRVHPIQRI